MRDIPSICQSEDPFPSFEIWFLSGLPILYNPLKETFVNWNKRQIKAKTIGKSTQMTKIAVKTQKSTIKTVNDWVILWSIRYRWRCRWRTLLVVSVYLRSVRGHFLVCPYRANALSRWWYESYFSYNQGSAKFKWRTIKRLVWIATQHTNTYSDYSFAIRICIPGLLVNLEGALRCQEFDKCRHFAGNGIQNKVSHCSSINK